MSKKRLVLGIAIASAFLIFIGKNSARTKINFFWLIETDMPISIAILFAFMLGALATWVFLWFKGNKKKDPQP